MLPVVLYAWERPWRAPGSTAELVALPDGSPLWRWQPVCRYYLIDMGAFPEVQLAQRKTLASLLFRLDRRHEQPHRLQALVAEVIGWFKTHPGTDELKLLFAELAENAVRAFGQDIPIPSNLQEINTMLEASVPYWKQKWCAEARSEAHVSMLLGLLDHRFGEVPPAVRSRVESADEAQLRRWSIRLLDAGSLDDVFDEA